VQANIVKTQLQMMLRRSGGMDPTRVTGGGGDAPHMRLGMNINTSLEGVSDCKSCSVKMFE